MRQISDILTRSPAGDPHAASVNGHPGRPVRAADGPTSFDKEMADLESVKFVLGQALDPDSYQEAKAKIKAKYGQGQ